MRIFGRTTTRRSGRVSVGEILRHGLDRHPRAVAIFWRDSQAVVCRKHATTPGQLAAMTQVRSAADEATLLTGGDEAARQLRRQCVLCP